MGVLGGLDGAKLEFSATSGEFRNEEPQAKVIKSRKRRSETNRFPDRQIRSGKLFKAAISETLKMSARLHLSGERCGYKSVETTDGLQIFTSFREEKGSNTQIIQSTRPLHE